MILSYVPLHLVPLIAALGAALLVLGDFARRARIGLLALVSSLVLLLVASVPLFRHETPFTPGPRIARIGSLDATLGLSLAPVSALVAGATLVGALAVLAARSERSRASEAAIVGLASAVTLGALADGFPALIGGTLGFGLMLSVLVGKDTLKGGRRVLVGASIASIGLALSASALFWGLGGKFLDGRRFLSDYHARFVAISDVADLPQAPHGKGDLSALTPEATGELTMTTHPGARVYLGIADEGQLNGRPPDAIAPFVGFKVRAGVQKIVIDPGGGSLVGGDGQEIALVDDVRFPPGSHVTIEAEGPTVTFREIARQLDREGFSARMLGRVPLVDVARAGIALALLALALAVGTARGSASLRALGCLGAVALIGATRERLDALLGDAGNLPAIVALATAIAAFGLSALATRSTSPSAFSARASGWLVATTALAVTFGAPTGCAVAGAGAALGLVAAALVLELDDDAFLRGAPKLEPTLRPAAVALSVGGIATVSVVAFGCALRGGFSGIAAAALAVVGTLLFAFTFYRGFFGLRREAPLPTETEGEKKPKRKKRKAKERPMVEAPAATARLVAILAAIGIVLSVLGGWLSKSDIVHHGGLAIAIAVAVTLGSVAAAYRARGVAEAEGYRNVLKRAAATPVGRFANGADTQASGGLQAIGSVLCRLDALFAWPLSAIGASGAFSRGSETAPKDEGETA